MIYSLGPFRLDTQGDLLFRGSEPLALGRRAIALLRALVERPGALVSKDALIEAGWPGQAVEESNLTVQVAALRRIFAAEAGGNLWIETMPRRGYRFIGPVSIGNPDLVGAIPAVPNPADRTGTRIPVLRTEPSIAVLPFQNMSGDPDQEYFVDGMVEEIITALSRIRWLSVLARNSSFTYKGQAIDVKQVGRELGVRYILEGSVRRGGDRLRITAQLIDAATGAHLWADRFDGLIDDVFELQDNVASKVAGVLEPELQAAETAQSAHRPTSDLTAYDLYLRACGMTLASAREIPEALRLLEQAIARDPRYGPALGWAAFCCLRLLLVGWSENRETVALRGADYARRALQVANNDPAILANAAQALAYLGEDIGVMTALVDRAVALNPNSARVWHISGILRVYAGLPDIAIEHSEVSLRLSPRARVGTSFLTIGAAHFLSRRFDAAVPKLLFAIQEDPTYPPSYRYLAACYAHMGRLDDARQIVERLRVLTPMVMQEVGHLRDLEHQKLFLSGVRLAAAQANGVTPPA